MKRAGIANIVNEELAAQTQEPCTDCELIFFVELFSKLSADNKKIVTEMIEDLLSHG